MNPPVHAGVPRFHVAVTRLTDETARAEAHGQTLVLAIKGGDPTLGFNPPEMLLTAFGACILSNITRGAAEMGLRVDGAEVVLDGVKRTDPLGVDPLSYRVVIHSPDDPEALRDLYRRSTTDGAVTVALLQGLSPTGELVIAATTPAPMSAAESSAGAAR
ncbi:MAG TPA: OsmC family protein [Candidatus Limnocylindrales bacterium]